MMKKIISLMAVLLSFSLVSFAQKSGDNVSSQGSFTVSLNYGNQAFHTPEMLTNMNLPNSEYNYYEPGTVYSTMISGIDERMSKAASIMLGYSLTDQIKLRASGGYLFTTIAPQEDIPGIIGEDIPTVMPVDSEMTSSWFAEGGLEYHFQVGRASVYTGVSYTYGYTNRYEEMIPASMYPWTDEPEFPDAGPRQAELYTHSVAALLGVDYYLTDRLYVGIESKIGNYMYSAANIIAAPGLEAGKAQIEDITAVSQPLFKVGFVVF